jgi:predicted AAA+ superfamily ATPase
MRLRLRGFAATLGTRVLLLAALFLFRNWTEENIEKCIKIIENNIEKCIFAVRNNIEKCNMLYRKIEIEIEKYLKSDTKKVLIIDGARQVGKSFIIRHSGKKLFKNYIEINMTQDKQGDKLFENTSTVNDFYLQLSIIAGEKMGKKEDTLIFLDEIQEYPNLLTLLKFLAQDNKFKYIASGSMLGIALSRTSSIPMGSIEVKHMYPLDLEEFLIANGLGNLALDTLRKSFSSLESLAENVHKKVLDLFKKYLLVGGMPDAVNAWLESSNIVRVRAVQNEIHTFYGLDASKYDKDNRLKIRRIYDMIPSLLENKKKRVVIKNIEQKNGKRYCNYADEFDYLINSGIALEVKAVSTPVFPLLQSSGKNLLKLYLNDVGILSCILYNNNINAILNDNQSVNLGSIYESVVASELQAHGSTLFYYDNKEKGEVDLVCL